MGLREAIRSLLDSDDTDESVDEVDELDGDEGDGDMGDELDEAEGDELDGDEGDGDEGDELDGEIEGTPGDEVESPEVAELRATIIEQAAQIETLRNRLAAAGIEDEIVEDAEVDEIDDTDDTTEEDAIAAFDSDYADRQAALAAIKREN